MKHFHIVNSRNEYLSFQPKLIFEIPSDRKIAEGHYSFAYIAAQDFAKALTNLYGELTVIPEDKSLR